MEHGNLDDYTYSYTKETIKLTRHRHFSEAELYRPFSQLYDAVEAQTQSKRMRSWGWVLISNGATHLIAACTSDLKEKTFMFIENIEVFYPLASACLIVAGIVLLIISSVRQYKPIKKEALIKKYLDREFIDDPALSSSLAQFADSVKDPALVMNDNLVVPHQYHPKHKADG